MLLPYTDKLKTITTDNGTEFAAHELISKRLGVPVYFTDPYSSGHKERLKMPINSSVNTSRKGCLSRIILLIE